MSDVKPKRPARTLEAASWEPAAAAATAAATVRGADPAPLESAPLDPAPPETPLPEPAAAMPAAAEPASGETSASFTPAEAAATDSWAALAEAQATLARGFEQIAAEMTGMTRSGITATANAAMALLGARTFAEAVAINSGLARRNVDTVLEGSARMSEIGVKVVAEASRPILSRLGGAGRDAGSGIG